ncbi:MAG: hypothetical protein GPJ54_22620 [Candidatus Heimdallarchaeota archaeon]|nr:hypothetical protein [Candidatus Heimdallarchaeota archaeon]
MFDFSGHLGNINAVCMTSNGNIIYAVEDQSIRIWDIEKKKTVHILLSMNIKTEFLQISSNDRFLAAGDRLGFIEIWDLETYNRICRIRAYSNLMNQMIFAADEGVLITVGESETYLLKKFKFDKKLNLKLDVEFDLEDEVQYAVITKNNKSVITMTPEDVLFFKFKNFKISHEFEHEDLMMINSSLQRDLLVGLQNDGLLKIWELKKLKTEYEVQISLQDFDNEIVHSVLDSEKKRLIFGNRTKLWIWDLQSNVRVKELKAPKSKGKIDYFNCLAVDHIEDLLIIGGSEKLRIIDINSGKNIQSTRRKPISPPYYHNYSHCHLSRDHKFVVSIRKLIDNATTKEAIEVFDMKKRERVHEIFPEMDPNSNISALTISADSKFFVTGDDSKASNGTIWNLKTGKVRKKLKELDYGVNSMIISEDSSLIITSDKMFDIEMFNAKTGKYLKKISSATKNVSSFVLTQDNTTLVCAFRDILDRDFDIIIWNVETRETIKQLSAEIDWEDKIVSVEFSPDERELIAKSSFGDWIKWETKSWKIKEKLDSSNEKITKKLKESIFISPFSENLILHVSMIPDTKSPIRDFLKMWLEKPKWISQSKNTFSLISELPEEEILRLKGEIELVLNIKE